MIRVVSVVDKVNTAIHRLSTGLTPYFGNIEYHVVDVHPKRPDPQQLKRFTELAKTADLMDYQYFRTADMLRQYFPWLKSKPSILTHHNPYSLKLS